MPNFDLAQRVAFVTGGNGGIGLGMAKGMAEAGATVVIAGRNKAKADKALAALRAFGGTADFVELDVLDEASCRRAVDDAAQRSFIAGMHDNGRRRRHRLGRCDQPVIFAGRARFS